MLWICGRLAFVLAVALILTSASFAADNLKLYVSPQGNDASGGLSATKTATSGPFLTPERARDEVRKLKATGALPTRGLIIEFQPGIYEFSKPLELTELDSGTAACPITWRSRPGTEVRFVGGKVVTGWKPVTDKPTLDRLAPAARGEVFVVDLAPLGIADYGQPSGGWVSPTGNNTELFFADQPMTIARWPNKGFAHVADITDEQPVDVRGTKGSKAPKIIYDEKELGDRPARWAQEKDLWLHGWWFWDWAEERHPVVSIDTEKRLITLKEPPKHPYGYRKGQWFYAFNALGEIDQPGEYYLDREAGLLYFWPPSPLDKAIATVSVTPTLLSMKDTSHVTWRGVIFETARNIPVTISGGTQNRLAACTIRNCGGYAATVSGTGSGLTGCDIYGCGNGGVILAGGDRPTLTPAGNYVDNCHIHHYSRWNRILRPGVLISGVGNRITHNLIDNAPHMAIQFSGNDHIIEYNEIHSMVYESNDAGVMYGGYNWTMRGHQIRYNYIHHIYGFEGRGCVGVYLDDMFSSANIFGNVFYKVPRAAFIGGGRDTNIENNIFVDCKPAIHVDARGLGWASAAVTTLTARLKEMPYQSDLWKTRYPGLVETLDQDPMAPHGNVVARNICVGGKWDEIEGKARPGVTFVDNLIGEDPHFVDAERCNFQLKADSPAFRLGFQRLPIEKIGLYRDSLRASWPVVSEIRPPDAPAPKPAALAPAPKGPMPTLQVPRAAGPITIDGNITEAEWGGLARAITMQQGLDGNKVTPTSTAWIAHDGANLLIAVDNAVDRSKPLQIKDVWGGNDAVEIALQPGAAAKTPPTATAPSIIVLRGYPNSLFHSDDEAGAPPAAVKKAAEGVVYKARVVSPGRWVTEWKIPFASLGLDPTKPIKFPFNLTTHKTAGPPWVQWQSTRDKCTWQADVAGYIEILP
ncbi:MAG: right-handed parallel beta-helix repeat-containing protein [Armatimonadota bacterium]